MPASLFAKLPPHQHRRQRHAGVAARCYHLLGRAQGDDAPTRGATFGPEVNHPVGLGDHVQVVLDDDDTVTGVDEAVQHGRLGPETRIFAHGTAPAHERRVRDPREVL